MSRVEEALKRLGIRAARHGSREWIACCPAHDDANPSWRIVDDPARKEKNGLHVCKSCGFSGGLVSLAAHVRGVSWEEARDWLAGDEDAEEETVGAVAFDRSGGHHRGFALPAGVVVEPLADWLPVAREYAESRGLTAEQVSRWGIGYALRGRLGGRIVLVARDVLGRPRSYSARLFAGSGRKYLTPDADEHALKGAVFGEQHWPALRRACTVHVCEGALNALAVERAVGGYVAILDGSEPHQIALSKLGTFGEVVSITDPDAAGDKAHAHVLKACARHASVRRVTLPVVGGRKLDPCDLAVDDLRARVLGASAA